MQEGSDNNPVALKVSGPWSGRLYHLCSVREEPDNQGRASKNMYTCLRVLGFFGGARRTARREKGAKEAHIQSNAHDYPSNSQQATTVSTPPQAN